MIRKAMLALACVLAAGQAFAVSPAPEPQLERVVIVMRHGVRPPTKSAEELRPLSDLPWPDDAAWGAAPGELTPHGAKAIEQMGGFLRAHYASLAGNALIWADGADQRTRATAEALGNGLNPDAPLPFGALPEGQVDPLFDALDAGVCKLDPAKAKAEVEAQTPLDTPASKLALDRLQQIVAPNGCTGGPGVCLSTPTKISADEKAVKLSGGLGIGATLAENLLLEYENGLPMDQVGWGRMKPEDLKTVMAAHERASSLTRRLGYIADRRASVLARFIVEALNRQDHLSQPKVDKGQKMIVLVGHDTNLDNLAGVFGLAWKIPGQPDVTAPGTALAFELWRQSGAKAGEDKQIIRVSVFSQNLDEVRNLTPDVQMTHSPLVTNRSVIYRTSPMQQDLNAFTADAKANIPAECRAKP